MRRALRAPLGPARWVRRSAARRAALTVFSTATALAAGVGWVAYDQGRDALLSAAADELETRSVEKQAAIEAWVAGRRSDVAAAARDEAVRAAAGAGGSVTVGDAGAALASHKGREFTDLFLLDAATGRVLAATDPSEVGKFREDQPYFLEGRTRPYVQGVYFSLQRRGPAMTAAAPVPGPGGAPAAVLAGRLDLRELDAILGRGRRQRTDDAYLVNGDNLYVTRPRFGGREFVLRFANAEPSTQRCLRGATGSVAERDYRGRVALKSFAWLPDQRACLVVQVDRAETLAPVGRLQRSAAAATLASAAAAGLVAVALSVAIGRPARALQAAVARFGAGDLGARADARRRDEIGRLASAFNAMAEVHGDALLLRIVLEQLLANAWKFTSTRQHARIEVVAVSEGTMAGFAVRDDGVGFDPAYRDKLFTPFQRLHPTGQFEGTGVGLATVARIAGRHGGRVHADGRPGQGATFAILLPERRAAWRPTATPTPVPSSSSRTTPTTSS